MGSLRLKLPATSLAWYGLIGPEHLCRLQGCDVQLRQLQVIQRIGSLKHPTIGGAEKDWTLLRGGLTPEMSMVDQVACKAPVLSHQRLPSTANGLHVQNTGALGWIRLQNTGSRGFPATRGAHLPCFAQVRHGASMGLRRSQGAQAATTAQGGIVLLGKTPEAIHCAIEPRLLPGFGASPKRLAIQKLRDEFIDGIAVLGDQVQHRRKGQGTSQDLYLRIGSPPLGGAQLPLTRLEGQQAAVRFGCRQVAQGAAEGFLGRLHAGHMPVPRCPTVHPEFFAVAHSFPDGLAVGPAVLQEISPRNFLLPRWAQDGDLHGILWQPRQECHGRIGNTAAVCSTPFPSSTGQHVGHCCAMQAGAQAAQVAVEAFSRHLLVAHVPLAIVATVEI
mmetsp:Transcript_81411/g.128766  ORF Transcript_81411/g.128766 Transcript_81411/m.128766 type:complete len:388 (+) Transcript_81411:92-1255(+)